MQVKNVECQIAQAQMRRYLAGEDMPTAVVSDLEAHLKGCADCMAAAQIERQSLAGVLSNKLTGKSRGNAAKDAPSPIPAALKLAPKRKLRTGKATVQAPVDMLDTPDDQFAPARKPRKKTTINLRTVAYSIGLALILVVMSTVLQDPTTIFGPRASEPKQDTPPPATETEQAPTKSAADKPEKETPEKTTSAKTADTSAAEAILAGLPEEPMLGNRLIIADSEKGTKVIDEPKNGSGEPENGSIKVYPPAKN